jgi:hypothetical protein
MTTKYVVTYIMGQLQFMAFGTGDTSIYRVGNLIVGWTEIYVPDTLYLVLISANINFAKRFVAFLLDPYNKCLYKATTACCSSCLITLHQSAVTG